MMTIWIHIENWPKSFTKGLSGKLKRIKKDDSDQVFIDAENFHLSSENEP